MVPTSRAHCEIIKVGGEARTNSVVISLAVVTRVTEVQVVVKYATPATSGIVLQFRKDSATGPVLFTMTSDGVQPNGSVTFQADGCGDLELTEEIIPAFTV